MNRFIKIGVSSVVFFTLPIFAGMSDEIKSIVSKGKSSFLKSAYSSNLYEPIWIKSDSLSALGDELIEQIKSDKTVAEDLPFYNLYKVVRKSIKNGKFTSALDIKITKLYKNYMDYLIKGGINWKNFDAHISKLKKKYDYSVAWEHYSPPYSSSKILDNAKLSDSFGDAFDRVEPKRFKYKKLKKELIKFIKIKHNGGWRVAHAKSTIKPGMSNVNIPIIRKRLKLEGDLNSCEDSMDSKVYNKCMIKAVKRFKIRHGFKGTSVIDRATRAEFSKSVNYYIKKIRLNLDRIKFSKREESRVRIELNIPAFRLYVYDGKSLVTTMRVVTGKKDHPTPIFSDVMTTVVVNPYWRIPESIVKKEMLKKLIKNPHHYEKQHKYLYNGWGPDSKKVDPSTVNWKKYLGNKKHIPYHFMQSPSGKNALGKIKFLFPNKYSVYIHDTPSKRFFFRETRAFSHGCMRIQKPRELLKALSLYNSNIKVDSIMKRLGTNDNKHIGLRRRVPVDITYFTSFVDDYGNLHFRGDVYGYDAAQYKTYYKGFGSLAAKKSLKSKRKKDKTKKVKPVKKNLKSKKSNIKSAKAKKHKSIVKKKAVAKKVTKRKQKYEVIEIGY